MARCTTEQSLLLLAFKMTRASTAAFATQTSQTCQGHCSARVVTCCSTVTEQSGLLGRVHIMEAGKHGRGWRETKDRESGGSHGGEEGKNRWPTGHPCRRRLAGRQTSGVMRSVKLHGGWVMPKQSGSSTQRQPPPLQLPRALPRQLRPPPVHRPSWELSSSNHPGHRSASAWMQMHEGAAASEAE